jgi:outer membrane lipopolysaccharide assembly protein LptE/RlpB
MKHLLTLAVLFVLAACGAKLDGTYTDQMGAASYTFTSDGKVISEAMGMKFEQKYELDGNKIKIVMPTGAMVMTLNEDGSIDGLMGMKLTKKKK